MASSEKWIWFSRAFSYGTHKAKKLLLHFGSAEAVYAADSDACRKVCGTLSDKEISRLSDKNLEEAEKIISKCLKKNIRITFPGDGEYPRRLLNISNPPTVLYLKGERLSIDAEAAVAVVGTRRASRQGEEAARKIGSEISECGGVTVTGLAKGIDACAAEGALSFGGKVIGVLGCGIDICYPKENRRLFDAVEQSGTIISEYPPGTDPSRYTFPLRNRIVSGISLGTVVVEAPAKSGALITASLALEHDRDVFAVPSGIFESAGTGSNELIREGAIPVMSGYDIMAEYAGEYSVTAVPVKKREKTANISDTELPAAMTEKKVTEDRTEEKKFAFPDGYLDKFSPDDRAVLQAIGGQELRADDIAEVSGIKIQKLLSLLTLLEIRGCIKQLPGGRFKIKDV